MNTWSFRAATAGLALTALAACDTGFDGLNIGAIGGQPKPLSQARMAFGAVTLVPPEGYCIDSASLSDRFALMARCDRLGAPSAAAGAPLGLITASFARLGPDDTLPDAATTATALGLETTTALRTRDDQILFRAQGDAPFEGMSGTHWRANVAVGGQVMSVALYAPEGSSAPPDLLTELIGATAPAG